MQINKFHMKNYCFNKLFFLNKSSKSQIFMFDLILASLILIVTVGIVFSYYISTTENVDIYDYNYEILSGMTQTKINSLNSVEIRQMFIENKIKNIDNTVAQQIGEFYHQGEIDLARNLTTIYIEDYVNKQMNFRVTIYNQTNEEVLFEDVKNGKNESDSGSILSVTQRTVFGFIDKDTTYGPDTIKIEIWM